MAGITAGGWGPGTVIKDNLLFDNQVGMLLGESDVIRGNRMIDNDFFGLVLADGTFEVEDGRIQGGGGGVWAIATSADTHITLDDVRFALGRAEDRQGRVLRVQRDGEGRRLVGRSIVIVGALLRRPPRRQLVRSWRWAG